MTKHLTQSQLDLGSAADDGTGDPGRTGGTTLNTNWSAAETAVNALAGSMWTLDSTARSLALGERVQSDDHAGITHTLPAVFAYDADGLNDIWVVNHDSADSITIAVASGDQIYRQGTGAGIDTSITIAPGQLAIFSIRTDSAKWNVIILADEQTIAGSGGGGANAIYKDANYTASADELVFADSAVAAFTVTLPAGPSAGDYVGVWDCGDNAGTNNIIVGRNGNTINGAASDFTIGADGGKVDMVYTGSTWEYNYVMDAEAGDQSASINNQTGTTYTIVGSDNGKIITFDNAAPIAVSLPDTLATAFQCTIVQIGAGVPTVTPNTDTINGAGAGVAPSAEWQGMYLAQYSATNWLALL